MNSKDDAIFTSIFDDWYYGNWSDARRRIRTLTKYQVASLLIHGWMCEAGQIFVGNRDLGDDFRRFVLASLKSKD